MNDFANPLSAASLMLAAIALVYSAWSTSIQNDITRQFSPNDKMRETERREVRQTMTSRALPLAMASTSVLVVFAARLWNVMVSVIDHWSGTKSQYDDVAAAFVVTVFFVAGLTVHLWKQVGRLQARL